MRKSCELISKWANIRISLPTVNVGLSLILNDNVRWDGGNAGTSGFEVVLRFTLNDKVWRGGGGTRARGGRSGVEIDDGVLEEEHPNSTTTMEKEDGGGQVAGVAWTY